MSDGVTIWAALHMWKGCKHSISNIYIYVYIYIYVSIYIYIAYQLIISYLQLNISSIQNIKNYKGFNILKCTRIGLGHIRIMATSKTISLSVILFFLVLFQVINEGQCFVVDGTALAGTSGVQLVVPAVASAKEGSIGRPFTRSSCFSSQHGGPGSSLRCIRRRLFNRLTLG